jgi:hypothetical protein
MKPLISRSAIAGVAISSIALAADPSVPEKAEKPAETPAAQASAADPALEAKRKEQEALAVENKLQA